MSDSYKAGDIFLHRNSGNGTHRLMFMKSNHNLCFDIEEVPNRQWSDRPYNPDKDTFTGLNIQSISRSSIIEATKKQPINKEIEK